MTMGLAARLHDDCRERLALTSAAWLRQHGRDPCSRSHSRDIGRYRSVISAASMITELSTPLRSLPRPQPQRTLRQIADFVQSLATSTAAPHVRV